MVTFVRLSRVGLAEIGLTVDAVRNVGASWTLERISTIVSVEERRGTSYTSEEPYFVRERYILVAAITIITTLGVWNIYFERA
jgi:hypothetical protein